MNSSMLVVQIVIVIELLFNLLINLLIIISFQIQELIVQVKSVKWYYVWVDSLIVMVFNVQLPFQFINIIFNFRSNEDNKSSCH